MIAVTTESIPGRKIVEAIGIVRGTSVRAQPVSCDILSVMKNIVGGELEEYTKMGAEAREQAYDRMIAQAESLDANAVVGVHFAACTLMPGAVELICYGTAVVVVDQ